MEQKRAADKVVERLQQQKGSIWFSRIVKLFHDLAWWNYAIGVYCALMFSSFYFFDGYPYPPLALRIGFIALLVTFALQIVEWMLTKATLRLEKIPSVASPAPYSTTSGSSLVQGTEV